MDNNQNNEVDFDTMTDDGEKITHIKEYIKSELHGTLDNNLATIQDISDNLQIIYSNIEEELNRTNDDEWVDNDRYREILEYKAFIQGKINQQSQSRQGGRKTKRKSRKSKKTKRKSRKSKKSRRKSRKSKRK